MPTTTLTNKKNSLYPIYTFAFIASLMIIVCAISFFFLSHESLRLDESQSLWQTSHSVRGLLHILALDVHVPLYHTILHFWEVLFGNGVMAARMLSLIFFLLGIPTLYMLAMRAYENRGIALFATTLFALSPFMNWYGNEIRMYTLFVLLSMLSHYFFLGIYKRGDTYSYVMHAFVSLLGIFTHYFFFFILFVQLAFYFLQRKFFPRETFRRFLITAGVLAVCFSPWIYYVWSLGSASTERPLLPVPNSVNVFNAIAEFFIGFQQDYLNSIIISSWPLSVLVLFFALRKYNKISKESWYFLFSAFIPLILVFLISIIGQPFYTSRYLIFIAPMLYLVASAVIFSYAQNVSRIFRAVILIVMIGTLGSQLLSAQIPVKENYREATAYINSNAAGDDVVIISAPFTVYPIEYYYNSPAILKTIPEWDRNLIGGIPPFNIDTFPEDLQKETEGYRNLWVVLSFDQGYEKDIHNYLETHYRLLYEKTYSRGLTVYKYQLRYD
jgi:mannosyltransferase